MQIVRKEDDMAKRRQSLRVRIPPYHHPRNAWRESIHTELVAVAESRGVAYDPEDKLELIITLYLDEAGLTLHDVDNRLKDIMDALQGKHMGSDLNIGVPSEGQNILTGGSPVLVGARAM